MHICALSSFPVLCKTLINMISTIYRGIISCLSKLSISVTPYSAGEMEPELNSNDISSSINSNEKAHTLFNGVSAAPNGTSKHSGHKKVNTTHCITFTKVAQERRILQE